MWSLVTSRGQRVALRDLPAVLGRSRDEADVALPHASIALRHARLEEHVDGGLRVLALEGALVEVGGSVTSDGRLVHGDTLVLGQISLRVVDDRAAAPRPERPARSAAAPPDDEGELSLRRPGPESAPAPARPEVAAPRGTREQLDRRRDEVLSYSRAPARRGLLHADLSQLSGPVRALLVLLLLAVAAGVVWGLSALVAGSL